MLMLTWEGSVSLSHFLLPSPSGGVKLKQWSKSCKWDKSVSLPLGHTNYFQHACPFPGVEWGVPPLPRSTLNYQSPQRDQL